VSRISLSINQDYTVRSLFWQSYHQSPTLDDCRWIAYNWINRHHLPRYEWTTHPSLSKPIWQSI